MTKGELLALHPDIPKAYEMLQAAHMRTRMAMDAEMHAEEHWTSLVTYHCRLKREQDGIPTSL
jgi:hypothetical protein